MRVVLQPMGTSSVQIVGSFDQGRIPPGFVGQDTRLCAVFDCCGQQ